jgi:hypothetical protein
VIVAPADGDATLDEAIAELRAQGEVVVVALPGETHQGAKRLVHQEGMWRIE